MGVLHAACRADGIQSGKLQLFAAVAGSSCLACSMPCRWHTEWQASVCSWASCMQHRLQACLSRAATQSPACASSPSACGINTCSRPLMAAAAGAAVTWACCWVHVAHVTRGWQLACCWVHVAHMTLTLCCNTTTAARMAVTNTVLCRMWLTWLGYGSWLADCALGQFAGCAVRLGQQVTDGNGSALVSMPCCPQVVPSCSASAHTVGRSNRRCCRVKGDCGRHMGLLLGACDPRDLKVWPG
jgi:hypothetical protein